jgi:hypothetical protein
MGLRCPKCSSTNAWLEEADQTVALRCRCGLMKFVAYRNSDGHLIMHQVVKKHEVQLPPRDTKLYRTLLGVAEKHPLSVCTGDVASSKELTNKETASLMVLLMARSLVFRVEGRKGLIGGSLWALTPETAQLMNLTGE